MAELEKAQETTSAPPYGSPNPPPPGQPYNQQTAPSQPPPQQLLTVQPQPPPLTGVHYYTQAYPAVSGAGKYSEGRTCHSHSHYPSPHTTQPQVVLAQPQMPIVATQQTLARPTDTKLPKYAFVTSVVATIIFTVLFWLPGLLCLVPATVMSIMVSSARTHTHTHTHTRAHARTHTPPLPLHTGPQQKGGQQTEGGQTFQHHQFHPCADICHILSPLGYHGDPCLYVRLPL